MKEKNDVKIKVKEEENFIEKVQRIVEENGKLITWISLGIVIVTVLFFVIKWQIEKSDIESIEKSSVALNRVLPFYQSKDYHKALMGDSLKKVRDEQIIGLIQIANEYSGTEQGKAAALYAADCYFNLEKYNEAIDYYKKASKSESNLILEGAYSGLAVCYEFQNNFNEIGRASCRERV